MNAIRVGARIPLPIKSLTHPKDALNQKSILKQQVSSVDKLNVNDF
jgi:hypothetical protein